MPADLADDLEEDFNPLKAVSFSAYCGLGPSGARPELLQALLGCGRSRVTNRLLRAFRLAESLAVSGQLQPRGAGASTAVWCSSPRRCRTGRVDPSAERGPRAARLLDSAQHAVAISGGTDILILARRAFREAVTSDPSKGVWVEVDVDFATAFPSLEHDSIDEAMQRLVPGVAPWCSWSPC